jgi:hypothetical protein
MKYTATWLVAAAIGGAIGVQGCSARPALKPKRCSTRSLTTSNGLIPDTGLARHGAQTP